MFAYVIVVAAVAILAVLAVVAGVDSVAFDGGPELAFSNSISMVHVLRFVCWRCLLSVATGGQSSVAPSTALKKLSHLLVDDCLVSV